MLVETLEQPRRNAITSSKNTNVVEVQAQFRFFGTVIPCSSVSSVRRKAAWGDAASNAVLVIVVVTSSIDVIAVTVDAVTASLLWGREPASAARPDGGAAVGVPLGGGAA